MMHKIERVLFWLLAFSIPFQARAIIYQADWYFNEYKAIVVHGTDIVLAALLLAWLITSIRSGAMRLGRPRGYEWWVILLLGAAGMSLIGTLLPVIGAYRLVKLGEGVALFFYVRSRGLDRIVPALVAGGVFQALIAIGQFLVQHDLGLQLLGESVLEPTMRGVAVFINDSGHKVLRGYGTTPHPNVVAAYLLLALAVWYVWFLFKKPTRPWLWLAAYTLILFGFFTTFARVAIAVWFLGAMVLLVLWQFLPKVRAAILKQCLRQAALVTIITALLFAGFFFHDIRGRFTIKQGDEALVLRAYYNSQALHSRAGINWRGLGIGNFVPWLMQRTPNQSPYLYQPAHNLYLLVYAELGVFGLAALVGLMATLAWQLWRSREFLWLIALVGTAGLAAMDHYFWTLQQGVVVFWLVIGAVAHTAKSR